MNTKKWFYINSGSSVSAAYTAILTAATNAGYSHPSAAIQAAGNTLINSTPEILLCNIFYIFANGGASQNFGLINWADPGNFTADLVGTMNYATGGLKGNAVDGYISTNWNAATNGGSKYTLNSACRGMWAYDVPANILLDGTITTGSRNCMRYQSSSSLHKINQGSGSLAGALNLGVQGFIALDLDTGVVKGQTGTTITSTTNTPSVVLSEEQTILKSGTTFGDTRISMYFCGPHFTDTQRNNIKANVETYLATAA